MKHNNNETKLKRSEWKVGEFKRKRPIIIND